MCSFVHLYTHLADGFLVQAGSTRLGLPMSSFAIKDERRGPFEALCFAADCLVLMQVWCHCAIFVWLLRKCTALSFCTGGRSPQAIQAEARWSRTISSSSRAQQ